MLRPPKYPADQLPLKAMRFRTARMSVQAARLTIGSKRRVLKCRGQFTDVIDAGVKMLVVEGDVMGDGVGADRLKEENAQSDREVSARVQDARHGARQSSVPPAMKQTRTVNDMFRQRSGRVKHAQDMRIPGTSRCSGL
jgi:hypothetical protein